MKTLMHPAMRTALGLLLLVGAALACTAPDRVGSVGAAGGVLAVALAIAVFATLMRGLGREDGLALREAEQCLARTRADEAVLEADLLLARLSAGGVPCGTDPANQLVMIQAELTHLQYGVADAAVAARLEQLRGRVERVAHALRRGVRTAEAG